MDHRNARLAFAAPVLVSALAFATGCASAPPPRRTVYVAPVARVTPPPPPAEIRYTEEWVPLEHRVTFEPNRATLTPEGESALTELASQLHAQQVLQVRVDGHVNSRRHTRYGEMLSARRAQVIKDRLIQMGFAPDMFTAEGHGDRELRDPDTRHGDDNRRVELSALVRHES